MSLVQAQRNFQEFGACDQRGRRFIRGPKEEEPLDGAWRPIDTGRDEFEDPEDESLRSWPDDLSVLCWWLPSFWGRSGEDQAVVLRDVVIDVRGVGTERELHGVLKQALGFPSFYGMNWDAFWDAVTGMVEMPNSVCFAGWAGLEARVPKGAAALRDGLARYGRCTPRFRAEFRA